LSLFINTLQETYSHRKQIARRRQQQHRRTAMKQRIWTVFKWMKQPWRSLKVTGN